MSRRHPQWHLQFCRVGGRAFAWLGLACALLQCIITPSLLHTSHRLLLVLVAAVVGAGEW